MFFSYWLLLTYTLLNHKHRACDIGAIALSDHAPVDLVATTGTKAERTPASYKINMYFQTNKDSTNQICVWNAFKAYMRWVLIQKHSILKELDQENVHSYEEEM